MRKFWKYIANSLGIVSLLIGSLHFFRLHTPGGFALWLPKLFAGAFAPILALAGALGAAIGTMVNAPFALITGTTGAIISARYTRRAVAPHHGFQLAFGKERLARQKQYPNMLQQRWNWRLPKSPKPRWQRDLVFHTYEDGRELLCDLWQPAKDISPSGLGLIYLHGSAWYLTDKDSGTRPFFRHLAAQGHLVMDIAYRLCPEADFIGMVADAKHALSWLKANSAAYHLDRDRIILSGGSAGAHIALLAAYSPQHPELTPPELKNTDLRVEAVISIYGPTDLLATINYHPRIVQRTKDPLEFSNLPAYQPLQPSWSRFKRLQHQLAQLLRARNTLFDLLGGLPDQVPLRYQLASPITHVTPDCPPTLLLQGEHDMLVPSETVRRLYVKLKAAGVPAVLVEFPQTDHAFDLFWPRWSPAAQAATHDVDRFIALF